ncbi:hypothetical protein quinque_013425 [Culex quinquefasciatus]
MAENGLERDGDMQRTHQQQQNGELDGVPAQQSQRQPVFPARQWCETPLPCPASPEDAAAAHVMSGDFELQEIMQRHNLAMVQLIQQQNDDFSQMMVSLQKIFFDWCVSSLALTGSLETLPMESTSRDDLVPEEGGELRYECERLLAPQHVGKIDPCSPEVDTAQLGMECSCMEPFATERGRQEEEDTVSMQLERSQVEFPRRLAETARIVTVITDEPWTGTANKFKKTPPDHHWGRCFGLLECCGLPRKSHPVDRSPTFGSTRVGEVDEERILVERHPRSSTR